MNSPELSYQDYSVLGSTVFGEAYNKYNKNITIEEENKIIFFELSICAWTKGYGFEYQFYTKVVMK